MKTEYVKISRPELVYGETSLLQSQLGLLKIKKQCENYKSLRKSEIHGKIELKRKLAEAKEHLDVIDRLLPRTHLLEEKKHEEKIKAEIVKKVEPKIAKKEVHRKKSIEEELAEINKKLAALS
ncbi:MAG: hypothetical protein QXD13_00935 [Candidatus Pacearchaeota archaeon]